MPTATVTRAWTDGQSAYLGVVVTEAGGANVHYVGQVPLDAAFTALTAAQQKTALVAAAKAARDASLATAPTTLGTITGTVTV